MKRISVGITVILILLLPAAAHAADRYINTASLFMFWPSARTIGLGGAFIAVADDEAALFYNPAGLGQLSLAMTFSVAYAARLSALFTYSSLGIARRNFGGHLLLLDSGPLDRRDLYGRVYGSFRFTSGALLMGTGHRLTEGIYGGVQIKTYTTIFPTKAFGMAISPALLFHHGEFSVGAVWRNALNIGIYRMKRDHHEPWIRDIAVGLAWRTSDTTLSLDFSENLILRGDVACMQIGIELHRFAPLVLRAGTNVDWSSIGFSLLWNDLSVDFAVIIYPHLPPSYLLSLQFQK